MHNNKFRISKLLVAALMLMAAGTALGDPYGLFAETRTTTRNDLGWYESDYGQLSDGGGYYTIERSTDAVNWSVLGTMPAGYTSWIDTTASPGVHYWYFVYSYYFDYYYTYDYQYGYTSAVDITTLPDVPSAPTSLGAAAASTTSVTLNWSDNSSNETGFKIERKTGSGGTYSQITTTAANATSYTDTGLTTNTTYYYRVRATNAGGDSSYSNEANAMPPSVPTAPSGLGAAAVSGSQINVVWTDNSSNESGFKLERKTGSGGTYAQIATPAANATSYADTGLSSNTTYYYRIRATNAGGNSSYSNQGSATTIPGSNNTASSTITYQYDPFGNLVQTTAGGVVTTMSYDIRGRKTGMSDPDMGSWTYSYNVASEIISQTDAKSQTTTLTYDNLGRVTGRTEPDLISTWTYDSCTHGVMSLCEASADNGYDRTYTYDSQSRVSGVSILVDLPYTPYSIGYGYDSSGRLETTTYPTGFVAKNVYNSYGYLYEVTDSAGSTVYWQVSAMDAGGHVTASTLGNGLTTASTYDAMNRLTANTVANGGTNLQNLSYTYDTIGNMVTRSDSVESVTENFYYDSLNRIIASSGAGLTSRAYSYDALGNITYKSDVGSYTYAGVTQPLPHAVSSIAGAVNGVTNPTFSYDANGNMTSGAGRTITYTSYNMAATVVAPNNLISGTNVEYAYDYNTEHNRVKDIITRNDGTFTTVYVHPMAGQLLYEKEIKVTSSTLTEHRNYINAGGLLVGVYISRSDSTTDTRYFSTDHLGSLTLITNGSGAVVERFAYEAFGKRRYPDGTDDAASALYGSSTERGFTSHEMMDETALINMNGRIYDPAMGRFMAADTELQFPDALQSYNRFSYVLNNPLAYTDPTGYDVDYSIYTGSSTIGDPLGIGSSGFVFSVGAGSCSCQAVPSGSGTAAAKPAATAPPRPTFSQLQVYSRVANALSTTKQYSLEFGSYVFNVGSQYLGGAIDSMANNFINAKPQLPMIPGSTLSTLTPGVNAILAHLLPTYGQMLGVGYTSPFAPAVSSEDYFYRDIGVGTFPLLAGMGLARVFPMFDGLALRSEIFLEEGGGIRWGPLNGYGPLGKEVASTFRGGSYTSKVLDQETTLYRAYGGSAGEIGPYWTRTPPAGPLQSIMDSALNPAWGNTAQDVSMIRVPAGTTIYEGYAAPQGNLLGGGSQVYIPKVNPNWLIRQ